MRKEEYLSHLKKGEIKEIVYKFYKQYPKDVEKAEKLLKKRFIKTSNGYLEGEKIQYDIFKTHIDNILNILNTKFNIRIEEMKFDKN